MTDEQIFKIIEQEIKTKTLGVTEQYLKIHNIVYKDDKPIIERIDRESGNNVIIAYLPIVDEKFYFAVYIDPTTELVTGFDTEAHYRVYFSATSENMSSKELSSLTKLRPTESWNKGDLKSYGKSNYTFSSIKFLPNPEPDEFEDKLDKLLDFLEQDADGIRTLVEKAFGSIQVASIYHNANGMLGGPTISKKSIRRMNELNLNINFDLYVAGNSFK